MAGIDMVESPKETGCLEDFAASTNCLRTDHDVTLVVDGKEFPAHKPVLAAGSKYFQSMFTTDGKEASHAEPSLVLTPECAKSDVFGVILEFIYSGELHVSEDNCFDVLIFGCYLQVNNLAQTCSSYIDKAYREKRLQFENPLRIFHIATKHNVPKLRDTALAHMACDFIEMSNTDYFLAEMTHDLLIQLFERTDLAVPSEEQVLGALIRWLKHDWDARKTYAWPVLQKVRLGLIPIQELRDKFTNELKEDKNCMAAYCELLEFHAINGIQIGRLLHTFDELFTPRNTNKGDVRNVFIKNLDKTIDDKALYDIFSDFGNILSFKQPAQQVNQNFPGFTGYYAPTMPQARWPQPGERPATSLAFQTMAAGHGQFSNPHIFPGFTGYYTPIMPQSQQGFYAGQMQGRSPIWPRPGIIPDIPQAKQSGLQRAMGAKPTAAAAAAIAAVNHAAAARTTHNMPRQAASGVLQDPSTATQQAIPISGQKPLTAQMLAAAHQKERRQMLGQRLYPIIYQMHGDLSGKITGMLLEASNAELLQMLESRDLLIAKVEEAVEVFKAYQTKEAASKVKLLIREEAKQRLEINLNKIGETEDEY